MLVNFYQATWRSTQKLGCPKKVYTHKVNILFYNVYILFLGLCVVEGTVSSAKNVRCFNNALPAVRSFVLVSLYRKSFSKSLT